MRGHPLLCVQGGAGAAEGGHPAFENAITVVMALGGSTNAVWLHRLG